MKKSKGLIVVKLILKILRILNPIKVKKNLKLIISLRRVLIYKIESKINL
jgi:hypothetical protein